MFEKMVAKHAEPIYQGITAAVMIATAALVIALIALVRGGK